MSAEDDRVGAELLDYLLAVEPEGVGPEGELFYGKPDGFRLVASPESISFGDHEGGFGGTPDVMVQLARVILSAHARLDLRGVRGE